jgi:hypothetical protein
MVTNQFTHPPRKVVSTVTKVKPRQTNQPQRFAARIWHYRAKRYLYASDYGLKGFPIGR